MKKIFYLIIALFITAPHIAMADTAPQPDNVSNTDAKYDDALSKAIANEIYQNLINPTPKVPALELLEHGWCKAKLSWCRGVCGVVRNNTSIPTRYPRVTVNAYDHNGNLVKEYHDGIDELDPGERWRFTVDICDERAVDYKVKKVGTYLD